MSYIHTGIGKAFKYIPKDKLPTIAKNSGCYMDILYSTCYLTQDGIGQLEDRLCGNYAVTPRISMLNYGTEALWLKGWLEAAFDGYSPAQISTRATELCRELVTGQTKLKPDDIQNMATHDGLGVLACLDRLLKADETPIEEAAWADVVIPKDLARSCGVHKFEYANNLSYLYLMSSTPHYEGSIWIPRWFDRITSHVMTMV